MQNLGKVLRNISNKLFIVLVIMFLFYLYKNGFNFGTTLKHASDKIVFVIFFFIALACEIVGNAINLAIKKT
jgi:Flp pilus assembly protein protease CpaA